MKWRQYLFSHLLRRASRVHEPMIAARKRELFAAVAGDVLEIGPGTGVNFRYLPAGVRWTGYEPNRFLARQIQLPANATLHTMPFLGEQPEAFDWAISTLVLCSVPDPLATLRDLWKALRPGGNLILVEHVAAEPGSRLRRSQERWRPLWSCAGDGCQPNRDTETMLGQAGFRVLEMERFTLPLWLASPHIAGLAQKPRAQ